MNNLQILMMGAKTRSVYGYLYNQYAVNDANFCPTDWIIPSDLDYSALFTTLGGASVAGGKLKETGTTYWNTPNTGADNSSGFTAYGNGWRNKDGGFEQFNQYGSVWSSDSDNLLWLLYNEATAYNYTLTANYGFAVRLLYDGVGTPTTVTDYEGNVYDVVQIGSQYWTVQNWKCTKLNNGTAIPNVTDGTTWAGLSTLARCAYDNNESYV